MMNADAAHIVNTSSINGFWASLGPNISHTAYSAAKFAVKGFSEALITDLKLHAPHVGVSVVMPGHVGTDIAANTAKVLGRPSVESLTSKQLGSVRAAMVARGLPVDNLYTRGDFNPILFLTDPNMHCRFDNARVIEIGGFQFELFRLLWIVMIQTVAAIWAETP